MPIICILFLINNCRVYCKINYRLEVIGQRKKQMQFCNGIDRVYNQINLIKLTVNYRVNGVKSIVYFTLIVRFSNK